MGDEERSILDVGEELQRRRDERRIGGAVASVPPSSHILNPPSLPRSRSAEEISLSVQPAKRYRPDAPLKGISAKSSQFVQASAAM